RSARSSGTTRSPSTPRAAASSSADDGGSVDQVDAERVSRRVERKDERRRSLLGHRSLELVGAPGPIVVDPRARSERDDDRTQEDDEDRGRDELPRSAPEGHEEPEDDDGDGHDEVASAADGARYRREAHD